MLYIVPNIARWFEEKYRVLMNSATSKITKLTGCNRPCSYKQYKFVNKFEDSTRSKNSLGSSLSMGLWAVSEYTQIEEEFLVYPFESFMAEFGGALGLFLGVSFMTIWDGINSVISLGKPV